MREQLRLLQTNRDVAAYPDGLLSLVKVGLEYFVIWRRAFTECKMFVPDTCLEPTDDGKGMRLTLLGQLLVAWRFIPNYVPTVEEWLLYCNRWLTALAAAYRIPAEVTASDILMQTYAVDITSEQKARVVLRRWAEANGVPR